MTVMPVAMIAVVVVAASTWGIAGFVLLIAAIAGLGVFVYRRMLVEREDLDDDTDLPPLLFPLAPPGKTYAPPRVRPQPIGPAPFQVQAPVQPEARPQSEPPSAGASFAPGLDVGYSPPAASPGNAPGTLPIRPAMPEPRAGAPRRNGHVPAASAPSADGSVQVGEVHFHRPPEGTLQLLPGRLEILAGSQRVDEIRFLKVPGHDAAVTFGRSVGEPHLHVQLEAPTVSRMHARMQFEGGRWRIANLSRTNPLMVNGEPLAFDPDGAAVLEDGDRLEMGQVIFRFRTR